MTQTAPQSSIFPRAAHDEGWNAETSALARRLTARNPEQQSRLARAWQSRVHRARQVAPDHNPWPERLARIEAAAAPAFELNIPVSAQVQGDILDLMAALRDGDAALTLHVDAWMGSDEPHPEGEALLRLAGTERLWRQLERLSMTAGAPEAFTIRPAERCALLPGGLPNPTPLLAALICRHAARRVRAQKCGKGKRKPPLKITPGVLMEHAPFFHLWEALCGPGYGSFSRQGVFYSLRCEVRANRSDFDPTRPVTEQLG